MSLDINNMQGRRFTAIIGEPWDFYSTEGKGILKGIIIKAEESNGKRVLYAECSPFKYKTREISSVAITSRYKGDIDFSAGTGVNIAFMTDGTSISHIANAIDAKRISWLIGSVIIDP
jgi:hypothetical protein